MKMTQQEKNKLFKDIYKKIEELEENYDVYFNEFCTVDWCKNGCSIVIDGLIIKEVSNE